MPAPRFLQFTFANEAERALETEIMKSDIGRATFMGTVFLILSALLCVVWINHDLTAGTPLAFFEHFSFAPLLAYLVFLGVYEWMYRTVELHLLRAGKRIPLPPRFFSAAIEVTLPTVFLTLLAQVSAPSVALNMPPSTLYYLFLALSVLRLSPALTVFVGLLAGLESMGLAFFLLGDSWTGGAEAFLGIYVSKGAIIIVTGLILAYVAGQIRGRIVGVLEAQHRQSRTAAIFGQHVSPAVMEKLLQQDDAPVSETRHVTVMFLDIRNFTTFSESRSPDQVVAYLNRLFAFMVDEVNSHHGIVNKFLGDGFMAVFGAPLDDGHSELHAVQAALAISERLEQERARGLEPTRIGIGLHSGSAVTGTVGSTQRQEYTLIGDVVNVASRIESQTKVLGAEILASEAVWSTVQRMPETERAGLSAIPVGPVQVKGRERPIELVRVR